MFKVENVSHNLCCRVNTTKINNREKSKLSGNNHVFLEKLVGVCKSDISDLKEKTQKISEIDVCKSDISDLKEKTKKISEIDVCKSDIANLREKTDTHRSDIVNLNNSLTNTVFKLSNDVENVNRLVRNVENIKTSFKKFDKNDFFVKLAEIDVCKSDISDLKEKTQKISEIDACKSDISDLKEKTQKISEIDVCKSDITNLNDSIIQKTKNLGNSIKRLSVDLTKISAYESDITTLNHFFEEISTKTSYLDKLVKQLVDKVQDIEKVEEDLKFLTKNIEGFEETIDNIKNKFYSEIKKLDTEQLRNRRFVQSQINNIIKSSIEQINKKLKTMEEINLVELQKFHGCVNDVTEFKKKMESVGISNLQKKYEDLKKVVDETDFVVKELAKNDMERIKETKEWVPALVGCVNDVVELKKKMEIVDTSDLKKKYDDLKKVVDETDFVVKELAKNDMERIEETKDWVPMLIGCVNDVVEIKRKMDVDLEIFRVKNSDKKVVGPNHSSNNFSLNSKDHFDYEIKKTMFFFPGLILPQDSYISSLYLVVSIKSNSKHNRRFELLIFEKKGMKQLYSFDKEASEEIIMEDFNTPLKVDAKTKILLTCDKKIEGMATLTLNY